MRRRFLLLISIVLTGYSSHAQPAKFIHRSGKEIIGTDGKPFLIRGTNLGNWLVPEGYMFKFKNTNSPRMINEMILQLIGPEATASFWKKYLDTYITEADIHYLKSVGVNSIRLPFNYRLFTNEDYLGANDSTRGFQLFDRLVKWCKKEKIFIILDMHCAPGGQTGDNIDDGWGYPFLFESETNRAQTLAIWRSIADRYKNESIIMGYDLLNEPIAHYFDVAKLNPFLEPFYKQLVEEIRTVDKNHIVFLGGAQWNTNFKVFGEPFDANSVYTFHKYGDGPDLGSIQRFIDFREKYNVPIYIGETGENTDEWVEAFRKVLEKNNIGWHFWQYKKMESTKNFVSVQKPLYYDSLIKYAESPRGSFRDLRILKPNKEEMKKALDGFLINCSFEQCVINNGYIRALGFGNQPLAASTPQRSSEGYSTPTNYPGKKLVWSDEFNDKKVNTANWNFETGGKGWGNQELQNYTSDSSNVFIANGNLVIEARKERSGDNDYTSARLNTKKKYEFQFGRVDIRAKLPVAKGLWPALWMLGATPGLGWPKCGETDIMELIGTHPSKVYSTMHWANMQGQHAQLGGQYDLSGEDFSDEFHVFSMLWKEDSLQFYVDDNLFFTFSKKDVGTANYPYNAPSYFIFNVAVGGRWPGSPDESTLFPQRMYVDYIRVFQ